MRRRLKLCHAGRKHNVILSFKRITGTIMDAFPHHTPEVFKQAELAPAQSDRPARLGDTRQLYNEVFLPRMQVSLTDGLVAEAGLCEADAGAPDRGLAHVQSALVAGELPSASKAGNAVSRLPLRSLSAQDMNARNSVPGIRAAVQR